MAGNTSKSIEDVRVGDKVMSWDEKVNRVVIGEVKELFSPIHHRMVTIKIGGSSVTCTLDHPFYVKGKGWCSMLPKLTKERYDIFADKNVMQLMEGDTCFMLDGHGLKEVIVEGIGILEMSEVKTYNFHVAEFNSYFANGILTHNK